MEDRHVNNQVVRQFEQNGTDRTGEAIALLQQISREFNVDLATVRGKGPWTRRPCYVAIRRIFCVRGRAMGLSVVELGVALNRDHTTVTYHSNPQTRARKKGLQATIA
jgi:chromosomal replication initiation ATPase DnaA